MNFRLVWDVSGRTVIWGGRPKWIAAPSGLAHELVAVVVASTRVVDEVIITHSVQFPLVHVRYHVVQLNVVGNPNTDKIGPSNPYQWF